MCRHLAWLGEPRSLAELMLTPTHGLLRQSYQPRRQLRGIMNADGWGAGFFPADADAGDAGEPVRWRSSRPLWGDTSFASVAPHLRSTAVLAAVRSASVGMPMDESAAAPFTNGRVLLSHNGRVERTTLPDLPATTVPESVCDSALLAEHVYAGGTDEPTAVAATVLGLAARDPQASLNLLLHDGTRIVGVTWGDPASYLIAPQGIAVASEPWDDDPAWIDVPDRHLIEVTPAGVNLTSLA